MYCYHTDMPYNSQYMVLLLYINIVMVIFSTYSTFNS